MGRVPREMVVWVSPQELNRAEGQYRQISDHRDDPTTGTLVQWVEEAPEDPTDGAGHYVSYDGDEAGYTPVRKAEI